MTNAQDCVPAKAIDLTEAQWAALREMRSYSPRAYHFRRASCVALAIHGFAEPTRTDVKRPAYCITAAGREFLKSAPSRSSGAAR